MRATIRLIHEKDGERRYEANVASDFDVVFATAPGTFSSEHGPVFGATPDELTKDDAVYVGTMAGRLAADELWQGHMTSTRADEYLRAYETWQHAQSDDTKEVARVWILSRLNEVGNFMDMAPDFKAIYSRLADSGDTHVRGAILDDVELGEALDEAAMDAFLRRVVEIAFRALSPEAHEKWLAKLKQQASTVEWLDTGLKR